MTNTTPTPTTPVYRIYYTPPGDDTEYVFRHRSINAALRWAKRAPRFRHPNGVDFARCMTPWGEVFPGREEAYPSAEYDRERARIAACIRRCRAAERANQEVIQ